MKTNNRLSKDNTSVSVVKQHRPMVKETEYLSLNDGWRTKEWLIEVFGYNWEDYIDTGYASKCKKREVERPMNETEYIEYLEKENQELKDKLSKIVYEKLSEAQRIISALAKQEQYFLKVVESVFKEHRHSKLPAHPYPCDNCSKCGVILNNPNVKYTLPLWEEHLLQEIKNSLQKSADLSDSQDKSAIERTNLSDSQDKKGKK